MRRWQTLFIAALLALAGGCGEEPYPDFPPPAQTPALDDDSVVSILLKNADECQARGDTDAAMTNLNKAVEVAPRNWVPWLKRAQLRFKQGQLFEAIDDCNNVLKLNPTQHGALQLRGICQLKMNRIDLALEDLNAALRLNPSDPTDHVYRGTAYFKLKDPARALADFQIALADEAPSLNDEDHFLALVGRAAIYSDEPHRALALKDMRAAIRLKPKAPESYYFRGAMYAESAPRQAAEFFDRAIELGYDRGSCCAGRAYCRLNLKEYSAALQDCDEALKKYPDLPLVHAIRAMALIELGKPEESIAPIDRAIGLSSREPSYYQVRARARRILNDLEGATADEEKAQALEQQAEKE